MTEKSQFGWMYRDGEMLYGAFDSPEEAIADAAKYTLENVDPDATMPETVLIQVEPVTPSMCLPQHCWTVDGLLEWMEERAAEEYGTDDDVFTLKGEKRIAEEALAKVLGAWADEHIKSSLIVPKDDNDVGVDVTADVRKSIAFLLSKPRARPEAP